MDFVPYVLKSKTYNDLLDRFPETDYRQLIYFDLYGVFTLMGDTISASNFLEKIKKEYPKNEQVLILNGAKPRDPKREMDEMVYENAYHIYLSGEKNSCKKLNQIIQEKNPANKKNNEKNWWRSKSRAFRLWVFLTIIWFIFIINYLYIMEPYGYRMNKREILNFLYLLLSPPIFIGAGYYGYKRFVH